MIRAVDNASPPGKTEKRTSAVGRFFSVENRYLPPLLITLILVAGQAKFGLLESFSRTAACDCHQHDSGPGTGAPCCCGSGRILPALILRALV